MKIHVIPSSKIAISVILSCWLLGKTSCPATVAKIFTFSNGTTPENVQHVMTNICAKFLCFYHHLSNFRTNRLNYHAKA